MSWFDDLDPLKQAAAERLAGLPAAAEARRYAGDGAPAGFVAYLAVIDRTSHGKYGVGIFDIADWTWRDAYEDGLKPGEALDDAVEADGLFTE